MTRVFISYTQKDRRWAEWIAWQVEAAGHEVRIQAWDFKVGGNFVHAMNEATTWADVTMPVLSPAYLPSTGKTRTHAQSLALLSFVLRNF